MGFLNQKYHIKAVAILFYLLFTQHPVWSQEYAQARFDIIETSTIHPSSDIFQDSRYFRRFRKSNNIYFIELGGAGLFWSINYERSIPLGKSTSLTGYGRIGASFFPFSVLGSSSIMTAVPVELGFYSRKKVGFEIGYGNSLFFNGGDMDRFNYLKLGIRMNKANGPVFKITPMLLFRMEEKVTDMHQQSNSLIMMPWIGVSFGNHF